LETPTQVEYHHLKRLQHTHAIQQSFMLQFQLIDLGNDKLQDLMKIELERVRSTTT